MDQKSILDSEKILEQEKKLGFKEFSHHDAWVLAEVILDEYSKLESEEKNSKEIGIRIVLDDLVVFQYLMEKKKEDIWLQRKQYTVQKTEHATLYLWARNKENGEYDELANDDSYVVGGGGFPIRIGKQIIGVIAVSGLDHNIDHRLIVRSIQKCATNQLLNLE